MAHPTAVDFKRVFETAPGLFLVLAPDLTIIAASNAFPETMLVERDAITGKKLSEVFPADAGYRNTDAAFSVNYVLQYGRPHKMAVQRIDIPGKDGTLTEKYLEALNTPIFNEQQEITCILHSITDVTSRETEKKKRTGTEHDYQLLVNGIKDYAIFMIDLNGCVASWNSGAEHIKGYLAGEVIGRPISLFYVPEDIRNGIPENNLQMAAQNGHFETEGWRIRKNGTLFWANIVITALKDEQGQLSGYSKITRDITERKKANDQVELLSLLINRSNDAIYTVDAGFKIQSWNRGAAQLYGYTDAEVLGKDSNTILNTDIGPEEINDILKKMSEQEYWSGELRRKTKDGRNICVYSSNTVIRSSSGDIIGYTSVSFDITEQKKLKQQVNHLVNLIEQSSEAIISRGIDRRLISWNKGAEDLFGYSRQEAIGKTPNELGFIQLPPEEMAVIEQELLKHGHWKTERAFYHKNGTLFYGLVTANAIRDEQNEITSLSFVIQDITLRKKLEAQLKRYNEELEEKVTARTNEVYKTEKKFRALIENSNDIITLMDNSFRLLYRSPAASRLLGWTDEDMIGVEATKNIHPDDKAYAASVVKEVMNTPGKTIGTRFRMMHKQGHYLWLEGTLANLLADKDINAVVFNFRNITERVEAEEKLVASEQQFRHTLDNLLEGIQIIDFNWRYIYVNDALTSYSRKTREELTGHTVMEVYPGVEQTGLFNTLERCMKERSFQQLETAFVFPDGSRSDFQLSIQPHPAGILILSIDITKAREAEIALKEEQEKFARIAAASPGLICSFRMMPDGTMTYPYASKAFEDIFGVPYETAAGNAEPVLNNFSAEDKEYIRSGIFTSAREMSRWQFQVRYNHPVKGLVWLNGHSIPTTVPDGSILWHGVITDVTERKLTEDKINEQNLRLKSLSDNLPGMMLFQLTGDEIQNRKFSYVSNGVTQLTGRTPEAVMNDPDLFYNLVDKEDAVKMTAALTASYQTMSTFNLEVRCRDFNGEPHWLNMIFVPQKLNNGQVVWDGFHLDITEKKNAEQELKRNFEEKQALAERMSTILNTLPANIALLDGKGFIREVNDAWRGFTDDNGFIGANHYIGGNYLDVSRNALGNDREDGKKVARGIQSVLNNEQKEFVYEYSCHSANTKRWFRMVVSPLQGKDHTGAVVMHIDISELRRLEEERLRSKTEEQKKITKAMLTGQEKERNHLGQELHDNISQILVSTRMLLGVAGNDNTAVKELVRYPMELLDTTIEEIRALCHKMVTPLKNIRLEELVLNILTRFEAATKIKTKFTYSVNNKVLSDELRLNMYRIIQELVNNIHKYAEAKNADVMIKTHDGMVTLVVADDGKGFNPKKKRKGVGISNILNRVASFNGELKIESSPGNGCRTQISIPC